MRKAVLVVLAGLAAAGSVYAMADKPAPAPPPPLWIKTPTAAQLQAARPASARDGGRAVIRCHVDSNGLLSGCGSLTETPAGSGYAQALAALASDFQMNPARIATEAPDGTITVQDETYRFDKPPEWRHKPTPNDLVAVWPKAAWARGEGGQAVISCLINLQGALYDCVTTRESPKGENFGAAAIALTAQFLMAPATRNGQPVVSTVNLPINFKWQGAMVSRNNDSSSHLTAPAAMAWLEAPSYADVAQAYPKKAREGQVSGHATIQCMLNSRGGLTACLTLSEEPKGMGFGAAAKSLADKFRAPPNLGGQSLNKAMVQLPFGFDIATLSAEKPPIGQPQWAALPTAEETTAAFAAVTRAGVSGTVRVMLACTVQPGGGMVDCKVSREDPVGKGVGEAALGLAPRFKVSTWTTEGLPIVGGTVNIPLRYEGDAAPAAPAAKP